MTLYLNFWHCLTCHGKEKATHRPWCCSTPMVWHGRQVES